MAERPTPLREVQTQPDESESPQPINDFWKRLNHVEGLLVEVREILEELRE